MKTMSDVFRIDGKVYEHVEVPKDGIKRTFDVLDTDKTGRKFNGDIYRDIIGTFYGYSMTLYSDPAFPKEYDDLYEKLSEPIAYHVIEVPYGQHMLTFNAYVTHGEDTCSLITDKMTIWKDLTIQFVAMQPQRRAL